MSIQDGSTSLGYDKGLTVDEQIADVQAQIEARRQLAIEPARRAVADAKEQITQAGEGTARDGWEQILANDEAHVAKLELLPLQALDGSTQANNLLQRLADLQATKKADTDTRARMRAEEARERAKNPAGTVAAR